MLANWFTKYPVNLIASKINRIKYPVNLIATKINGNRLFVTPFRIITDYYFNCNLSNISASNPEDKFWYLLQKTKCYQTPGIVYWRAIF